MPVSKKRKKKQSSGPPPAAKNKAAVAVTPKKKKLSRQQIIIYVISGLMILSLAIGLIATGSSRQARALPTSTPVESLETPSPDNEQNSQPEGDTAEDSAAPTTTAE